MLNLSLVGNLDRLTCINLLQPPEQRYIPVPTGVHGVSVSPNPGV